MRKRRYNILGIASIAVIALPIISYIQGKTTAAPTLADHPPKGAGLVLTVAEPGEYNKPDDEAETARKAIWGTVPAAWQPAGDITIVSRQPGEIIDVEKRDRYAGASASGVDPGTLTGFTSLTGNDTTSPKSPTTIYLSRSLWGDDAQIAHWAIHEFGHTRYYSPLMPPDRQAKWKGVWTDAKARRKLPSDYAGTNEFEGFAESFAFYCEGNLKDEALKAFFDGLPK